MLSAIVVADTSVLINFLRIDRMDLFVRYPCRFLVTDHVASELAEAYPDQQARYAAAIAAGQMDVCSVTDPGEVELFLRLRPGDRLGAGECSAIAVAMKRQHGLAIDDHKAVKTALREVGMDVEIIGTADIMVALIRAGSLDLVDADAIKDDWEQNHRFRIKVASFADLL
jgi:predicted nucleic acid-binding protein